MNQDHGTTSDKAAVQGVMQQLKDAVINVMRTTEPNYGEELVLETQEILVRGVAAYFDNLILDIQRAGQWPRN